MQQTSRTAESKLKSRDGISNRELSKSIDDPIRCLFRGEFVLEEPPARY